MTASPDGCFYESFKRLSFHPRRGYLKNIFPAINFLLVLLHTTSTMSCTLLLPSWWLCQIRDWQSEPPQICLLSLREITEKLGLYFHQTGTLLGCAMEGLFIFKWAMCLRGICSSYCVRAAEPNHWQNTLLHSCFLFPLSQYYTLSPIGMMMRLLCFKAHFFFVLISVSCCVLFTADE